MIASIKTRTTLFPEAPVLLAALVEAGALASCWTGAGPCLLGITTQTALAGVGDRVEGALASLGFSARVLRLQADRDGLVYGDAAELPA